MHVSWYRCFPAIAILVLIMGPAAAGTFEPAQVIAALKREMLAAEAADANGAPVRIEEAMLDLGLVEVAQKSASRLLVPGADFGAEKGPAAKPPLRRRMLVDLARTGNAEAMQPDPAARLATGSTAGLAGILAGLRSAVRPAADAPQDWACKRLSLDLEFAVDRDPRGAPVLLFLAADQPINARNVQKLKLRLAARER